MGMSRGNGGCGLLLTCPKDSGYSVDSRDVYNATCSHLTPEELPLPQGPLSSLSVSNQLLLREAVARDWTFEVLDGPGNLIAVFPGKGERAIVLHRSRSELGSAIGSELATNKLALYRVLNRFNITTPRTKSVDTNVAPETILAQVTPFVRACEERGMSCVVKPKNGSGGVGVTLGITDAGEALAAVVHAVNANVDGSPDVLIQEQWSGDDVRVLVIGHRVVAAAVRRPAFVTGDGEHTVRDLVELKNAHPWRGSGHESPLTKIDMEAVEAWQSRPGCSGVDWVPMAGEDVELLPVANLSQGGEAIDVTDALDPHIAAMCVDLSVRLRLPVCGVDLLCDVARPESAVVIEVNVSPGLRMHHFPTVGVPRNVAGMLLDAILEARHGSPFPQVAQGRMERRRFTEEHQRKIRIVCLMDHQTSKESNSIWSLVREMSHHPDCAGMWLCSRMDTRNASFFHDHTSWRVRVTRVQEDFGWRPLDQVSFVSGEERELTDFDFVLFRLSRPIDRAFLDHIGEVIPEGRVLNGLSSILRCGSKAWLTEVADICPPLAHCHTLQDIAAFVAVHHKVVLKPLQSGGGKGITMVDTQGTGVLDEARVFVEHDHLGVPWSEYVDTHLGPLLAESAADLSERCGGDDHDLDHGILAMKFLDQVADGGDKRVLVVNGTIVGCSLRMPPSGSWVCNAAMGGTSHATEVTAEEEHMAQLLTRRLKPFGVVFFGFDTLLGPGGKRICSEINPSNVGGLIQAQQLSGEPVIHRSSEALWEHILDQLDC